MDRFVVRIPKTDQKKEIKQAGHKLKTIQLNCGNGGIAQSHLPHSIELREYLSKAQPDIVLLQETWLHQKSTVSFPGYVVLRQDRPADYGVKAGGVATLIRSGAGIKYEKIDSGLFVEVLCNRIRYPPPFYLVRTNTNNFGKEKQFTLEKSIT